MCKIRSILAEYRNRCDYLVENLMTVDESWICYEPKLSIRSAEQWLHIDLPPPELGRIQNDYAHCFLE